MNEESSKLKYVYDILPLQTGKIINRISMENKNNIEEIRLRNLRPLSVTVKGKNYFLSTDGVLKNDLKNCVMSTYSDIEFVYLNAFRHSLHSFGKDIIKGSVIIEGGNRVGFCGHAILDSRNNYCIENIKNISSVNIRIAREVNDCSKDFFEKNLKKAKKSVLIAGTVSSGKTTFLRDLTKNLGDIYRVSLIDESCEISASTGKNFGFNVGFLTDIFSGYNKYEGIMSAVKNMSPEIIVCDEIGGEDDLKALEYCLNSGVKLCATCHSGSIEDALKRKTIKKLVEKNAFDIVIFLENGANVGKISDIKFF